MHPHHLTTLTHAPAAAVKALAEHILDDLGAVAVLRSRTGLVMVPARDSAQGALFHLGEALVAEAHVRLESGHEGYALVLGRDLEQAMAIAVLDAALNAGVAAETIVSFIRAQAEAQAQADQTLLRQVAATRVEMETF